MPGNFTAHADIFINKPVSQVWKALTDPAIIKEYFFGTEAVSDWKEGSSLEFRGVWEGKEYTDKGIIKKFVPEKELQYTYLSSFSNAEDNPENYALITYRLQEGKPGTNLSITQDNIASGEIKKHSEDNWNLVLNNLKNLLEK